MQREDTTRAAEKKKKNQEAKWGKEIASGVAKLRRNEERYLEEEARLRKKEDKKEAEQEIKKKDANKKKKDEGKTKEEKATGKMMKAETKKTKSFDQTKTEAVKDAGKKAVAKEANEKKIKTKKLTAAERAERTARNKKIGPAPKHEYKGIPDDMRAQVSLMHKANNMLDVRKGRSHHGLDITASFEEPLLDECRTQTESISPLDDPTEEEATHRNSAPKKKLQ